MIRWEYDISEIDWGDGDIAWAVELATPPFGTAIFSAPDLTGQSRELLCDLIRKWDNLWPEILEIVQEGHEGYGEIDQKLGSDEFIGSISAMKEGCYMSDKSDVHLGLEFGEPPRWDFFLKGRTIVHHQPVF